MHYYVIISDYKINYNTLDAELSKLITAIDKFSTDLYMKINILSDIKLNKCKSSIDLCTYIIRILCIGLVYLF